MGLIGKLIGAVEFKAGGDVFHELLKQRPHDFSTITPDKVQGCDLHDGEFGTAGSIICWRYTHDGKEKKCKILLQTIDEDKKLLEFKVIEGDLMEQYKAFLITVHVETKGNTDLITWTFEYEMLNEDVGHPFSFLSHLIDVTKDIENHHVQKA